MKKYLLIIISFWCLTAHSQAPTITINLSPNPNSDTSKWGTGSNIFNILVAGANMNILLESKILVTIKNNGAVKCGAPTSTSAQPSNITTPSPKSWIGSSAQALLDQDCILSPGSYEICVQFYGSRNGVASSKVLLEKCMPFNIADKEQEVCSPPININPAKNKIFEEKDLLSLITFNWSPIISSHRGIVTYRLFVWEVEEGETNSQAIYNSDPIIQEDVKGQPRYMTKPGIIEKRSAKYVWRVIALDSDGNPICKNAQSEPTNFEVKIPEKQEQPQKECCTDKIEPIKNTINVSALNIMTLAQDFNISPKNIKKITAEIISFDEDPVTASCIKCVAKENWVGNFIGTNTESWNSGTAMNGSPLNSDGYYPAKMVEWNCNQQGSLSLNFKIALPGAETACARKGKIGIRYTFTNIDCVSCEKIIYYNYTSN